MCGPRARSLPGVGVLVIASVVHQLHHRLKTRQTRLEVSEGLEFNTPPHHHHHHPPPPRCDFYLRGRLDEPLLFFNRGDHRYLAQGMLFIALSVKNQ